MVLRAVEKLMKETAMNGNIPGKFTSGFNRPNFSLVMLFKQVNVVCSQLLFHQRVNRVGQHLLFLSVVLFCRELFAQYRRGKVPLQL